MESRTNTVGWGLFVELDRESSIPAHVQLEVAIRDGIRTGRLKGESVVPSSRRLAQDLGLSRGVVVEAYQQLTAEGYLISQAGGYTRVASGVTRAGASPGKGAAQPASTEEKHLLDFRYGRPDVTQFPRAAWLRSLRKVLTESPHDRLNYLDGRGAPELRAALADYLNRVRGTWATPDNVVACNGFAQAVALIMPVIASNGVRRLAVEDPSDGDAVRIARAAGLEVVGIPVTPDGIDVAALARSEADAILVTPAHQFPTGCVLSSEARTRLLAWANDRNALILEDDYDAEYRYDETPVGALHGLAPDRVLYAGTASKTLAPGLRLGWMVVPDRLVDAIAALKVEVDRGSPVIDQLAFAEFLRNGDFDRHLRRMRPIYRRRRDVLIDAMNEQVPELDPVGIAAGLHIFAWLPPDLPEVEVIAAARRRGLMVAGIHDYRHGTEDRGGLLLGYAKLQEDMIRRGVGIVRRALDDVLGGG
ncbi:PLP-dependent aminotransferase family protein [Lysobacter korlensis]|uniref:PLP-dependent aminotransferase family protein n=1 Tax=Lysobacter korlensis TaxID=553636 RepID=A0ABV6RSV8_9GAMM